MFAGYYLISSVLPRLPILAALILGLVLVGRSRARIGRRPALFAQLGLGALMADSVIGGVYTAAIPQLYRSIGYSSSVLVYAGLAVNVVSSLLAAIGVLLLVVAVITRVARTGAVEGVADGAAYGAAFAGGYGAGPVPYSAAGPAGSGVHGPDGEGFHNSA